MQVIPYRNKHGALYNPGEKPQYIPERKTTSGGYLVANLVFCPESGGLKWIGHCEKCTLFNGHQRYQGVRCESTKPYKPPRCYKGG